MQCCRRTNTNPSSSRVTAVAAAVDTAQGGGVVPGGIRLLRNSSRLRGLGSGLTV